MMQMTVDQVVDVVAVRNRLVAAAGSMHVIAHVRAAHMRHAAGGIHRIDRDRAIIKVTRMRAMEVTVVKEVDVVTVAELNVAAARAVLMIVVCVNLVLHRRLLLHVSTHQMR